MARHDIRGQKTPDGTYVLTAKDIHNINDNNIQLSQEVFGNSGFTRKIDSRVKKAEGDIVLLNEEIENIEGDYLQINASVNSLNTRMGNAEGDISTLEQTATSLTTRISNAEGDVTTLEQTASGLTASINTTTHSFTAAGYTLRDTNGEALMTANGVANEQNIVVADNVENGYPMKIPFHLGTHVSSISEVKLKWKNYPFRTYSKGAASGGGTKTTPSGGGRTSGASSRSTTYTTWGSSGVAEGTSSVTAVAGLAHQHTIALSKLAHSHGMDHTHWLPDHSHSLDITHSHEPVFGILEEVLYSTRYAIGVYVDGVYRTTVNAAQGEVDLSSWITTSGWHEIELTSQYLKRISATVFMKTYIRR